MKFIILIVLWTSLLCISPTYGNDNSWDELENLLERVDAVGERVITDNEDDDDDESTLMQNNVPHESDLPGQGGIIKIQGKYRPALHLHTAAIAMCHGGFEPVKGDSKMTVALNEHYLMHWSTDHSNPHCGLDSSDKRDESVNLANNPCHNHPCGWGKECNTKNGKSKAHCDCARRCPEIPTFNANDKVCSNRNQTFDSICHLYRERCLCKKNDPQCTDFSFGTLHLEYLGACKELQPCTSDHLQQFSERMVGWLFQVMKDMKKRQELHGYKWLHMLEEAENDDHLKHVYPVVWKYCDLDRKPHDKAVTHQELIPIIAPVMPMESCIKPFLKSCDSNHDDLISLAEWGTCLGLSQDEITERC